MTLTERPSGFNSVHLPIVYKLSSDKWPNNTVDTVRTATQSDDAGYTKLALSGDIKATGSANELEYVKVEVNGEEGIYQIFTWYSDTSITIDLDYDAGNTIGDVQYYYANYHGRFKIYSGLRVGHFANLLKPYRLLTEVKALPNSSGEIILNINEILKSDIKILDNDPPILAERNDIDSFCEFYIEYAEAYDYSVDGYTLNTYVGSYTSDSANYAIAVNSKLPFRNGYGGVMTEYVGTTQKFLTLFTKPTIFYNNYFELSFLRQVGDDSQMRFRRYLNGSLFATNYIPIDENDEGFYRVEIFPLGDEDKFIVDLFDTGTSEVVSESIEIDIDRNCYNNQIHLSWRNYLGAMEYWSFTAEKEYGIEIEDVKTAERNIFINWPSSWNAEKIKYDIQRNSRENILVRSQNLTLDQVNAIKYIKTSPLVQVNERDPLSGANLKYNVLVDSSSFTVYTETDKLYSISFTILKTVQVASLSL